MAQQCVPSVSIVMPVYNGEQYLRFALDSIARQTYPNIELIVVDNASTDLTPAICKEWSLAHSEMMKYIRTEEKGVSHARNIALDCIDSDYVGFVDADDCVAPNFVDVMVKILEESGCDIASIGMREFENQPEPHASPGTGLWEEASLEDIFKRCFISSEIGGFAGNKMYRVHSIQNLRFDEKLALCEDQYFLFTALRLGCSLAFSLDEAYFYRKVSSSASHDFSKGFDSAGRLKYAQVTLEIIKLFEDRPFCCSLAKARLFKVAIEMRKALFYESVKNKDEAFRYLHGLIKYCRRSFIKCPYYSACFKNKYLLWYLFAPLWSLKKVISKEK